MKLNKWSVVCVLAVCSCACILMGHPQAGETFGVCAVLVGCLA